MAAKESVHGIELIDKFLEQSNGFMNLWLQFNQILAAYPSPGVNKVQLESQFLRVKSELARQHQVLTTRLYDDAKFGPELINVMSGATDLASIYSQSEVAIKKLQNEWHRGFISINETVGILEDKHKRASQGERVRVGGKLVYIKQKKPVPWKKVLLIAGAAAAVLLVIGSLLFMRYFLGFWAPQAGEGLEITDSMTDMERIYVSLASMRDAVAEKNVDQLMSAYSDSFRDPEGRGKRELRIAIQGFKTAGEMDGVTLDYSTAEITIQEDVADISPVVVRTPTDEISLRVVASREGDRWLITYMDGL